MGKAGPGTQMVGPATDMAAAATQPAAAAGHRRRGRPRSERADHAIIDAALSLFAEAGPEGLCMEKVAARAGVGKATLYRRWHGKEDLLLDAMAALTAPLPAPVGRSARDDLVGLVRALSEETADPRHAREFALLLGEGTHYPRLMARYIETVVEPRREVIRDVLRRGVASGELRPGIDIDVAMFMLMGAVLARGRYENIPPGYAERVVDEMLRGLASGSAAGERPGAPGLPGCAATAHRADGPPGRPGPAGLSPLLPWARAR